MVPPKSPDLQSAFKILGNGPICEKLDQVRANANSVGKEHVDNIDKAICVLTLDVGYDADMVWELMGQAYREIIAESQLHLDGDARKKLRGW